MRNFLCTSPGVVTIGLVATLALSCEVGPPPFDDIPIGPVGDATFEPAPPGVVVTPPSPAGGTTGGGPTGGGGDQTTGGGGGSGGGDSDGGESGCSVQTNDCPIGQGCQPSVVYEKGGVCSKPGNKTYGSACGFHNECAGGYVCVYNCRFGCDPDNPVCKDGGECHRMNRFPATGYCVPPGCMVSCTE